MKQIRFKDHVMKISCCGRCPCAGRNSMGEYCYIEGKYMDFDDIPEWCPLEDYVDNKYNSIEEFEKEFFPKWYEQKQFEKSLEDAE